MLMDSVRDYFVKVTGADPDLAAAVMLLTTAATVFLKVLRAAMKNPSISLKYE